MMILAVLVLASCGMLSTCVFFDKVVDVPVVRRSSSSTVLTPTWSCASSAQLFTWRIDFALGSEFKSCPPVAAHPSSAPIKWLSAAIREFKKCPPVAFHPSCAHQMAPPGAIAHSRARLCPRASPFSFSSLVSPLRPLGLRLLGCCDPRSFFFYDVTDAGPASHRVRLWQGGPASRYCRFRLLVLLLTGTRLLRVRLLGHPNVRKRPWPLWRPRVASSALPSWRGLRLYAVHQMLSLCSLYSNSPLTSRPQPFGRVGDDTPCEDTREDFRLFV